MSFRLDLARDALFLDVDGTLLDIAPKPDTVVVSPQLIDNLATLHSKLNRALALISGRTLDDLDRLFHPLRLPAAGVHGAEWRIRQERERRPMLPEKLRRAVFEAFSPHPALVIEDKEISITVHYRQAPEMAKTVQTFLKQLVEQSGRKLKVMRGKMVCEVVDPSCNKGTALEHFMKQPPFAGRRPVFLGDDITDLHAIKASRRLGGIGIRIQADDPHFSCAASVRRWLRDTVHE